LAQICELQKIVCIGIYVSENSKSQKQPEEHIFLDRFVKEMSHILNNGINIDERKVDVKLNAFVCDTLSRIDLKKIVTHNSHNACERCSQFGGYAGGHVCLLDTNAPLRSDDDFKNKADITHHKPGNLPIITNLNVGMVSSFVLDYMHNCCLGVTKRLLVRWKGSRKYETKCHLDNYTQNKFSETIDLLAKSIPREFNRKCDGGLKTISHWKASEFRLFLLYTGMVALKNILPSRMYKHFLHFSFSLRLLLADNQECNIKSIRSLLINFVLNSQKIYGNSFVSINVHSIIHLPDDYMNFGSLDSVSCFPFESYLGQYVKGQLTGRNQALKQICRHLSVQNQKSPVTKVYKNNLKTKNGKQFYHNNFLVHCAADIDRDNCIMVKSGEIMVIKEVKGIRFNAAVFRTCIPLVNDPIDSRSVGVFQVSNKVPIEDVLIANIHCKMIILPMDNEHVAIKLLHT
jgi:hypothetical protein